MQRFELRPDCNISVSNSDRHLELNRRGFLTTASAAAALATTGLPRSGFASEASSPSPENLVKSLYDSLSGQQRSRICFGWDHTDKRGLLRTHVSNNWSVTDRSMNIISDFYTSDQKEMIEAIFYGLYNPEWHDRIRKQLKDDAGGYGRQQTIAIFGTPGSEKFELVMTGRHLTIRCDGNTADHVAFGGPVFYGHQAVSGEDDDKNHTGNVFWPQAVKANGLYQMLDGRQRKLALVKEAPYEAEVEFRGSKGGFTGIPVSELSKDQTQYLEQVLDLLVEPYRLGDRKEALDCLNKQGGLAKCHLSFYQSDDIGDDGVWDNWRLEGPAFVWHFRGSPHVHVWVNVSSDPSVTLNAG